ncbi:MAG TPA: ATP-binding cassette domain-containing protein [Vicinamibacterales bacterium]|nr:ATP-binding cassette domain-containing protein [Vicinamibacterales bacterium]
MSAPVLRIAAVRKQYQGLRPLRVQSLTVGAGERVALSGFDAGAAEVLVNLITGASVPDEGTVEVCGHATDAIADGDDWLAWLDRFGIVSPRAVLLEAATLGQNLAMPLTLAIDPVPPEIAAQVETLADDVGLDRALLGAPVAGLDRSQLARAHLARAIALGPSLLIVEHPTIGFTPGQAGPFGETVARVAGSRSLAALIISEDTDFSSAAAPRRLRLQPASGELKSPRRWPFGQR